MAVRTPGGLCLQRMLTKYVVETREQTYTVTVKVPVTVMDPVTMKTTTQYRDQHETKTRVLTVPVPVLEQTIEEHRWEDCRFLNREGAKLSTEEAQRRLTGPLPVVRLNPGESLPEKFRVLFKPDTLCVSFDGPGGPQPPAGPIDIEGFRFPDGPLPRFRQLSLDASGRFVFRNSASKTEQSTFFQSKTELRTQGETSVPTQVTKPVIAIQVHEVSHTIAFPADSVQGRTVDGGPLVDRHREVLRQREFPVIVNDTPQPLDKQWLTMFQPQMLVMNVPSHSIGAPIPSPVPAPEPANTPLPVPAPAP
jgi:hypothetical protein